MDDSEISEKKRDKLTEREKLFSDYENKLKVL